MEPQTSNTKKTYQPDYLFKDPLGIFNNSIESKKNRIINIIGLGFGVSLILSVVNMLTIILLIYIYGPRIVFTITPWDAALLSFMSVLGFYLIDRCGINELLDIFFVAANCSQCAAHSIKTTNEFGNTATENLTLFPDSVCVDTSKLSSEPLNSQLIPQIYPELKKPSKINSVFNFFSISRQEIEIPGEIIPISNLQHK